MNNTYTQQQKQEIREQLKSGIVGLHFIKNDGTDRWMRATLCEGLMPPQPADSHAGPPNEQLQVVWDLEAGGWRSFRWERLKQTQF
jgi:hypothetical protein